MTSPPVSDGTVSREAVSPEALPVGEKLSPTPPASPIPLGATYRYQGGRETLFAFYGGRNAQGMSIGLFESSEQCLPDREIPITQSIEAPWKTGGRIWHISLPVHEGQSYGVRVFGPYDPRNGERYTGKYSLDPYAFGISRGVRACRSLYGYRYPGEDDRIPADPELSNAHAAPLAAVIDTNDFDWGNDTPPNVPWEETLLYETHVKGLTMRHPGVRMQYRGTFSGLASAPIRRHLKKLGVTAVELMPIHPTDARKAYWRYDSLVHFAPEPGYCAFRSPAARLFELKSAIKALHRDGLEVILDVVFNHTAEGHHLGPTLSFRGFANGDYYLLGGDPENGPYRFYVDHTGCGNSLNLQNPVTLRLVLDALRYAVLTLHIDGFRFDLATVLSLLDGNHSHESPFLTAVSEDPVLSKVKLIAEPWDTKRLHRNGFPKPWREWNDLFRDDLRRFWRGDSGMIKAFRDRLRGSPDLYTPATRGRSVSINAITTHDGFTLNDLVSYKEKENWSNGEGNRDGNPRNFSDDYGHKGPTDDPIVCGHRDRQIRNLMASLLLSDGVPMILGGDEIRRTQLGNNNAYCHDGPLVWYDWENIPEAFLEFVQKMSAIRRRFAGIRVIPEKAEESRLFRPDGSWMNEDELNDPELRHYGHRLITADTSKKARKGKSTLWMLINGHWSERVTFTLPTDGVRARRITRILDTSEIGAPFKREILKDATFEMKHRSIVVLQSFC